MHRRILLGLGLLAPVAAWAQRHWLVGRWEGEAQGGGGSEGPGRVLVVEAVGADGKVRGAFSNRGGGQRTTELALQGETLRITTGNGNDITLRRTAPDRLEGDYISTSGRNRRVTVTLARVG